MVVNNNSKLTEELITGAKLQVTEGVPNKVADFIQPTMEVNPRMVRTATFIRDKQQTTTGTATLSLPANVDIFLSYIGASIIKDATCDTATGGDTISVRVTQDGAERKIISFACLTTTAQALDRGVCFSPPLKLDKNSSITFSGSFTVGNLIRSLNIAGYVVDNSNA